MNVTVRGLIIVAAAGLAACGGEADPVSRPAAPTGLTGTPISSTEVELLWTDNAEDETGYRVERSEDAGATFAQVGLELAPGAAAFVDDGCVVGTVYQYRVKALGAGGSSASNVAEVEFVLPVAPSAVTATATSESTLPGGWPNDAPDATGFHVYRSEGGDYALVGTVGAAATSFDDTGLAADNGYWYRVTTENAIGESALSEQAHALTLAAPLTPPAMPGSLSAGTITYNSVALTWTDASDDEAGFEVAMNTSNDLAGASIVKSAAANATGATVTGLTASTTYYFWVRAFNAAGASAYSIVKSATTLPPPPAAPSSLKAATTVTADGVKCSWTDNSSNETGFRIYSAVPKETRLGTTCVGVSWTEVGAVGRNVTAWTYLWAKRPTTGTRLCWRVGAYNDSGEAYSNPVIWTM